jgi:hypothetical protein
MISLKFGKQDKIVSFNQLLKHEATPKFNIEDPYQPAQKITNDLTFTPKDRLAQTLLARLKQHGNLVPEFNRKSSAIDNDYLDLLESYRMQLKQAPQTLNCNVVEIPEKS